MIALEMQRYGNLGGVVSSLVEYVMAKEYYEKALAIDMEIGHRAREAKWYENLGKVFQSLGEYITAKEYHEKGVVSWCTGTQRE